MILYCRLKRLIKGRVFFDRWIGSMLVHYNYYEDTIEIKNSKFEILESLSLKFFKFKPSQKAKQYLKQMF